ncbi:NAD-dependent nucleoside diphosphate-sugar epimerase/dehydratase [Citrifermentans bemidjiense Bem]|uniref:NAD-dependent nucleoside diphosphate-sugar epimerase/dehydratase n=1 Tax=Citrifermentans bemidjiense (strain ATCC BAA-1014 / DSM 16622 / JCM 12645 / Bem) TaxID=404380 RepID=B5E9F9_CITBB|nr:NAD-dependent epimerase/dehydratase family protein [Citrifermentans bemidjiense]ACH38701.1 NAD-dependent nucleoside diphosphate-sugar epimerase/dehydratase [Citrifermentans bemidjiense Bem]
MKRATSEAVPEHFGIVEWFRPGERERVERVLSDMKAIGAKSLRTGISWADWYTSEGKRWYDWLIPRLAREVELLPCVLYTPPSIGIEAKTSSPPRRPKDYADFIDLFVTAFGEHFEYLELWNEPNNLSEWDWTLDPHWTSFGEMIGGAAYWVRKRGKKTVLGGMSPIDGHWLCRMFELGVMDYIDVVGIHGFPDIFDYTWKGWQRNIAMVREILDEKECACEIWVTEAGFSTWQHDEFKQAKVFLDFLAAPAQRVYWYGVDDLDPSLSAVDRYHLDEREYFFGLRKADATPKLLYRLLQEGTLSSLKRVVAAGSAARADSGGTEKAVLVTGGAGFIGTNLVQHLVAQGERVILYDNLSRAGVEKNLLWLMDNCGERLQVVIGDTRNSLLLEQAVSEAKQVFHFAAQVAVSSSIDNPANDFAINVQGTFSLLEAIRKAKTPPSLLYTSTNKVYGAIEGCGVRKNGVRYEPLDPQLRSHGLGEGTTLDFLSPYGCSKGCADQYVLDYARSFGIDAAVFRMSCIYGPHQYGTEEQGWVAHFAIQTMKGEPITLYGDGCQIRDLLFVEDLVDAMCRARDIMPRIAGQAFNIGGGPARTISLLELLDLLRDLHGTLPTILRDDWRTGDQRYYVSDTRKFCKATGWTPRHSVAEGVRRLYDWLLETMHSPARGAGSFDKQSYPATGAEAI